jgi:hypothetical protein
VRFTPGSTGPYRIEARAPGLAGSPLEFAVEAFASMVDTPATGFLQNPVLADMNDDDRLDVVIGSGNGGLGPSTVNVLLNNTPVGSVAPSFSAATAVAVGNSHARVAVADLNGDGKPDLIAPHRETDDVVILLNTTATGATTPTFAARTDLTVDAPSMVAVGDVNRDGKPDLVIATLLASSVLVVVNQTEPGASTLDLAAGVPVACPPNPGTVALADFDGDGVLDIAVGAGSSTGILRNATAAAGAPLAFDALVELDDAFTFTDLQVADLNRDGKPDLVGLGGGRMTFLRNTTAAAGGPASYAASFFEGANSIFQLALGDFDFDGNVDVAGAFNGFGQVGVFANHTAQGAAGVDVDAVPISFVVSFSPSAATSGDVNGDGKPDLILVSGGLPKLLVLLHQ